VIEPFEAHHPVLGARLFIARSATVAGRVALADDVSVWFGAVLRGDVGAITIGARTNLQDLSVVHVTTDYADALIGADVTVGHGAILHGCTVGDHVLVGMGAILLDKSEIGEWSLVGAGAIVTPGTRIPPRSVVLGSPARVVRPLAEAELKQIEQATTTYLALKESYATSMGRGV
jgi:gamma-carbonic anhydrase